MFSKDTWDPISFSSKENKTALNTNLNENKPLLLIIDKNPNTIDYLESILNSNFDIIYSKNSEESLEKALKYVPDLILINLKNLVKTAVNLCSTFKKNHITIPIPIILLSSENSIKSIKKAYNIGVDEYLIKPCNNELLLIRINNLIKSREVLRKNLLKAIESIEPLSSKQQKPIEKEKEFLRKLDAIILKNLKDGKATVKDITKEIGMSRTPLFRKIKDITGGNINEYITMIKLKKSAALIKYEDFSISQAAFEVGYNSPKYFRKLFKEQFGMVPSKYKNHIE